MSEHLFKFLLSELKTIRFRCQGERQDGPNKVPCGMIFEVPIERIGDAFFQCKCPVCSRSYFNQTPNQTGNPFQALASALESFRQIGNAVEVEFSVPIKD